MMRYKPMLAYPVSKKPINYTDKIFMQPKLDGVRCVIQCDNDVITAYSRTGKEWKNIEHIKMELRAFFDKYPKVILDGELYNHDLRDNFEKIISLVRKQKPTEEQRLEASNLTQFHCYDVISLAGVKVECKFEDRIEFVNESLMLLDYIHIVDTYLVGDDLEARVLHQKNLALGYEGSILRTNDSYACKRSHNLRKFKDFSDKEATIVGYLDGKGKREGTLGKFIMQDDEGIEFGCPPGKGYNYKDLANMLSNVHDYIGQRATFTYFERTKAGSYRHPLFKTLRNYE